MKKNKIFLFTLIYAIIYIFISYVLKVFNYTFLVWIKNLSTILISVGIIAGSIQFTKNLSKEKKKTKIILYLLILVLTFIIMIVNFFYLVFIANLEEVSEYEGIKMLKETRQVLKSNYIKYYDYTNPFIRSMQERVYMSYDDTISEDEYGGTTFYNKEGEEVQDIYGTEFIDLSSLKQFASEGNASYADVLSLLEEVNKKIEQNIYKVDTSDNYLFIYLTNNEKDFIKEEIKKQEIKNTIENFKNMELTKENSYYSIRFWSGYIAICNDKYNSIKNNIIPATNDNSNITNNTNTNSAKNEINETIQDSNTKKFDKSDLEYFVDNNKYYTVIDNKKIKIISLEEACDIADKEAKKETYQYQSWKSEFYSRHENWFYEIYAKLILELSNTDRVYLWNENWKTDKYKGQLMWQIRLGDANDPLTDLYIYIDAVNGDVLGAGSQSD